MMEQSEKQSIAILAAFFFILLGFFVNIVKPIIIAYTASDFNSTSGVQKDVPTLNSEEKQPR